jgi:iron complex transport system ATP-binding protein
VLQAQDLAIGYPGHAVGQGFELALAPGRVLALLGPNGGGKTTLLKTLLGLLPPRGGQVLLDGQPLARHGPQARARRLAYVPQSHAGAFAFTVADLVLMGRTAHSGWLARPSAHDRAVAQAAIERMGIAALAQRPAAQVSGGERQLALIARALAQEAGFVVLDEPTASLDFGNQGKVLREIRQLATSGLGVIFSTHDPNHASRWADEALLIRDGRMLACGPVADVIQHRLLEQLYGSAVTHVQGTAAGGPGAAPAAAQAFLPA